jgi:hypothetical protein
MRLSTLTGPALAGLCAAALSGCWLPPAHRAEIFLTTTPPGASCILTRLGRPIATVSPTPAIARVAPRDDPITVSCRRHGYRTATLTLPAEATWPSFATVIHGTPPYDYRHRVALVLVPSRPARR